MNRYAPHPHVLWSWELLAFAAAIPMAAASVGLRLWERVPTTLSLLFSLFWLIAWSLTMLLYLPARRRRLHYAVNDDHLLASGGVLFRTRQQMPLHAIRHVTLLQGPVERHFHTAFLWVAGAGGWIVLEGLSLDEALAVQQRLLS